MRGLSIEESCSGHARRRGGQEWEARPRVVVARYPVSVGAYTGPWRGEKERRTFSHYCATVVMGAHGLWPVQSIYRRSARWTFLGQRKWEGGINQLRDVGGDVRLTKTAVEGVRQVLKRMCSQLRSPCMETSRDVFMHVSMQAFPYPVAD